VEERFRRKSRRFQREVEMIKQMIEKGRGRGNGMERMSR